MPIRIAVIIAGIFGLLAVLAGTFGAHGLKDQVADDLLIIYETGVRYQMYHALALLAIAGIMPKLGKHGAATVVLWSFGMIVFSGSLYALAITGNRSLGAITPIGGVALIAGWVLLLIGAARIR